MTLIAIGRTPDEFAAAVWFFGIIKGRTMCRDQDALLQAYRCSLLGTLNENANVYDVTSPLTYLKAAKASLLTIQGENDIRVPRGQAQEVNDSLKANGDIKLRTSSTFLLLAATSVMTAIIGRGVDRTPTREA